MELLGSGFQVMSDCIGLFGDTGTKTETTQGNIGITWGLYGDKGNWKLLQWVT